MYREILLFYERDTLRRDSFIDLASYMNIDIDDDFIDREIFFNRDYEYQIGNYGRGKVFIFYTDTKEEFMLISTYLCETDQLGLISIGIRSNRCYEMLLQKLWACFDESQGTFPLSKNTEVIDDDRLLSISSNTYTTLPLLHNYIGDGNEIEIVKP
ncbi:hypothetical protein PV797_07800 [Clostridiaceae bacterium M8S5]|nr:hypothetical protein PV797_07800 [Clostridiaceae bacterium M8S5]